MSNMSEQGSSSGIGLRLGVFMPAFGLIFLTIIYAIFDIDGFLSSTTYVKDVMINTFGGFFSLAGVASLIMVGAAYFSKFGDFKIGGANAKPLMARHSCIFIVLCTTIAAGILFWGTEEPIYHLAYPPASLGIEPMSADAAKFAMETMFLHWTFMPYAFYTVPTIVFAYVYYNMKKPYSIGSQIAPLFKDKHEKRVNDVIDVITLVAICFAIASSFGTSVLNIGGGLNTVFGIPNTTMLWVSVAGVGSITFILSAKSGLFKGIKYLSTLNTYIYIVILSVFVIFGPAAYIFNGATEALGGFLTNLFDKALFTGTFAGDSWPQGWTTFYWSNWMAWAPVTAVFLARLAYGYTVKQVIITTFVLPSIFSMIWMSILSGTAIYLQMTGTVDILAILNEKGPGFATYAVMSDFPLAIIISSIYVFAVFISFVTATDSTLNAMAGISTQGLTDGTQEAPVMMKIAWGGVVTTISLIFIAYLGLDGIKMLSYLGGIPALILGILCVASLGFIISKHRNLNVVD